MRRAVAAIGVALATAAPPLAQRSPFPDAPPPAMTGGFGEPTCVTCHFAPFTPDSTGSLAIAGIPARFEPGRSYVLTVALERPGMKRAGFELAVRRAEDPGAGLQAGTLAAVDPVVAITDQDGVQYAHQTAPGTEPAAPGRARWSLRWTAPAARAPVVFHAVGNGANGDESPLGDVVFAVQARVDPAAAP